MSSSAPPTPGKHNAHASAAPAPRRRPDLDDRNDLERSMEDRRAEDQYVQLMLNSVREGKDPNETDDEGEFEGYVPPTWDGKAAQRRLAEVREHLDESLSARRKALKVLRATPSHQELSAFRRLMAEAELWTGQRTALAINGKGRQTHRTNSQLVEDLEAQEEASQGAEERLVTTPNYIRGSLRHYQLEGVRWLLHLCDRGINGILADEMGLGKTFQTISLLAYLKHTRGLPGPHLVVAPKSVLGNWYREIKKWCPTMLAYKFHGSSDIRPLLVKTHLNPPLKYDVVLTTYEMVIAEQNAFRKVHWRYLIIDEAHKLKNSDTVTHQTLDRLNTDHRLLVTGTPLQNDLKELWALLHFLIPDLFSESEPFAKWFDSRTGEQETSALEEMHLLLAPLMLRRLKSETTTDLPPKKEIYVGCKLSKKQREWYMSILAKDADAINRSSAGTGGNLQALSNIVMQLRKVCNHPYLFPGAEEGPPFKTDENIVRDSGKMIVLDKILKRLHDDRAAAHKVLIFSQMTRVLDILEDYLTFRGYKYFRLDGSTSGVERETQMAQFNSPNSPYFIFLLSTRAGGLGINLQAANHVVLFDSDWNPQADLQAQDRAHRIGQKRPVRVYRFITDHTFEEQIYRRALKKLYLDAMVVEQGRLAKQNVMASKEELLSMIKFGAQDIFKSKDDAQIDLTDADVDALLATGEQRVKEMQSALAADQQACLATFKLGVDDANIYQFEGINFQQGKNTLSKMLYITLPEPMSEDDIHAECSKFGEVVKAAAHPNGSAALVTFRTQAGATDALKGLPWQSVYCSKAGESIVTGEMINTGLTVGDFALKPRRGPVEVVSEKQLVDLQASAEKIPLKLPKKPSFPPYQLFNMKRLLELYEIEVALLVKRWKRQCKEAQLRFQGVSPPPEDEDGTASFELTLEEVSEREQLLAEGFSSWSFSDFRAFGDAVSNTNPSDYAALAKRMSCGKTEGEVRDYSVAFWGGRGKAALGPRFEQIERKVQRVRDRMRKEEETRSAVRWKLEQYSRPAEEMKLKSWKDPHLDRMVFFAAYDHGMDAAAAVPVVRGLPEAAFDVFLQSRTPEYFGRKLRNAVNAIVAEKAYHDHGGPPPRKRKRDRSEEQEADAVTLSAALDEGKGEDGPDPSGHSTSNGAAAAAAV